MKEKLQAGAITVKPSHDGPLILIATATGNPHHWILPKGTIKKKKGETPEQAAIRELCEEAGAKGVPVGSAGTKKFKRGGEWRVVEYFVMQYAGVGGPGDGRQIKWLKVDEAISWLTHDEAKQIVDASRKLIARAAAAPQPPQN